ncbi:hypothetical protein [Jhaorihella thermophila]|uniref:Methyltransferase domain-containing protein n=1 Tax=Jhaorihella thermophila TaxID=488547 RepID=A0A1H5SB90_9RHOB|nr:hypothetical protein [Jhaorihella thermophila]SEF47923.1 hypothetical protein SAMN05421751_101438 [Jhaorihella thermophila]
MTPLVRDDDMADRLREQAARPVLTMPEAEAGAVRSAYRAARVILEYGSGGSTVLAAEMPGKHVTSVESDRRWARMMKQWFRQNPPAKDTTVEVIWSNIGPTRDWGQPKDQGAWHRFARYPLGVWRREDLPHPDVVLVDGRFRIGCALATAFNIRRPVTLLFDDYAGRKWFHQVEDFLGAPLMVGRMGVFEVEPQPVPPHRLLDVIRFMQRP